MKLGKQSWFVGSHSLWAFLKFFMRCDVSDYLQKDVVLCDIGKLDIMLLKPLSPINEQGNYVAFSTFDACFNTVDPLYGEP